ncbi:MAG: MoaD/ThiS family protein [Gammaproteobacteria bacterium]|jgi:molybdopterin synthase sulfur carrier subunit|nr:MoaD/ThiS family protein [Gammaproteobacteria bacterium]|tara:strand:- start:2201 stop:2443 length:243 start_codon:yes stop_codon:yes gene_type:complete
MKIDLSGPLRKAAGGIESFEMEAKTIRELLQRLVERYPAMQQHMDQGIAVAIDGTIYRDDHSVKIPAVAEIYLLPRIQGG